MKLRYQILKKRHSKIHLHDLILVLKCLYPHRRIDNPFEEKIYEQADWSNQQKDLVKELIYASCLFNQQYRSWNKYEVLQAEEEDFINAISLAQSELNPKKPSALLTCGTRRMLIEIVSEYGGEAFKARALRNHTYMSKSQVHNCLQELKSKGLLRIVGGYENRGYLYQLTEKVFI